MPGEDDLVVPEEAGGEGSPEVEDIEGAGELFGISEDLALQDPAEVIKDRDEAKKSGQDRSDEIAQALADEEHPAVKKGREAGGAIVALGGEEKQEEGFWWASEITDGLEQQLKDVGVTDVAGAIEVLQAEVNRYQGGREDIFTTLRDDQVSPEEGQRRRAAQEKLISLKGALTGASEVLLVDGRYALAADALEAAKIDTDNLPPWYDQALSGAFSGEMNLSGEDEQAQAFRSEVMRFTDGRLLSSTTDERERLLNAEETDGFTGREWAIRKGMEAARADRRIKEAIAERERKVRYEQDMEGGAQRMFNIAVEAGERNFTAMVKNRLNLVRTGGREGDMAPSSLLDDHKYMAEHGLNNLRGADGWVEFITRAMREEKLQKRMVGKLSEMMTIDHGGRTKRAYMEAGDEEAWQAHVESVVDAQLHGQATAIIRGVIMLDESPGNQYSGGRNPMTPKRRKSLIRPILEVMGDQKALRILGGRLSELSPSQQMVSRNLVEFARDLSLEGDEARQRWGRSAEQIEEWKRRLPELGLIARQADEYMLEQSVLQEREAAAQLEREGNRRVELKGMLDGVPDSVEKLRTTAHDLETLQAKQKVVQEMLTGFTQVDEYVTITQSGRGKDVRVSVALNSEHLGALQSRKEDYQRQLERETPTSYDAADLRGKIARIEAQEKIFEQLGPMIAIVDNNVYKDSWKTSTLGGWKPRISAEPFGRIQAKHETDNEEGRKLGEAIKQAAESALKGSGDEALDTQQMLDEALRLAKVDDLLENDADIASLNEEIEKRSAAANEAVARYRQRLEETFIPIAARHLVRDALYWELSGRGAIRGTISS